MLAVGVAALATLPAPASARPGYEVHNRHLLLELTARTKDGYRLAVTTLGHRKVELTVSRLKVSAVYTTAGRVSRHGIRADFGDRGRIAVSFHGNPRSFRRSPGGNSRRARRLCRGRRPTRELGSFRGTIRFVGEHGFTRLATHHARGEVRRFYRLVCRRAPRRRALAAHSAAVRPFGGRANLAIAVDRSRRRTVALEVLGFDFGPGQEEASAAVGSLATATVRERREGLRILRTTEVQGGEGSLLVTPPGSSPLTAAVKLPKPFAGSAEYRKEAGTPASWSGSLRAWLPGAGTVPLTGREYSASLCRIPFSDLGSGNRCIRQSGLPLPGPFRAGTPLLARIADWHSPTARLHLK